MDDKAFFYQLYKDTATHFQEELKQIIPNMLQTFPENDPLRLETIRFVSDGGKRLRPVLARIAARSIGVEDRGVVGCLEAFHKFLLCHDDIIDRDKMRYGMPAVHSALENQTLGSIAEREHFGNALGIVSGDLISSMSMQIILNSDFDNDVKVKLISLCATALDEVAWGWCDQFRMDYEPLSAPTLSFERIMKSIVWVTGKYSISFPLRFGFALGKEQMPIGLEEIADKYGVLFQTGDDLIGILGDSKKSGKSNYGDIQQGKKTIPLWFTYELANDAEKSMLINLVGKQSISGKEVELVRKLVVETGALKKTKALMSDLAAEIRQDLSEITLQDDFRRFMVGFADYLCEREA